MRTSLRTARSPRWVAAHPLGPGHHRSDHLAPFRPRHLRPGPIRDRHSRHRPQDRRLLRRAQHRRRLPPPRHRPLRERPGRPQGMASTRRETRPPDRAGHPTAPRQAAPPRYPAGDAVISREQAYRALARLARQDLRPNGRPAPFAEYCEARRSAAIAPAAAVPACIAHAILRSCPALWRRLHATQMI